MDHESREKLKRNSSTRFQNELYKHSPMVDIPLKETYDSTKWSHPKSNVTPLVKVKTLDNSNELETFFPSKNTLEDSEDEASHDELDDYLNGGRGDCEADSDLDEQGE